MATNEWATTEDWRQWVPDAPELNRESLLTRAEILALLGVSAPVSASDLRFWEYTGVLPRPVRQWKDGATRALYPLWYAMLVRRLREFQKHGLTLKELPPRMRAEARHVAQSPNQQLGDNHPLSEFTKLVRRYLIEREATPRGYPTRPFVPPRELEHELRETLVLLAALLGLENGIEIETVEIALKDRYDRVIPYQLSIASEVKQLMKRHK